MDPVVEITNGALLDSFGVEDLLYTAMTKLWAQAGMGGWDERTCRAFSKLGDAVDLARRIAVVNFRTDGNDVLYLGVRARELVDVAGELAELWPAPEFDGPS